MSEPAFQHDQMTSHVGSLHFSDDSGPFKLQRFDALDEFNLIGCQLSGASTISLRGCLVDLVLDSLAFPTSRHTTMDLVHDLCLL
jgi:hypothetical protein